MNKTFKFAAMALPLLLAACSQDELIENVGAGDMPAPGVKGYNVTLAPTLGDDTEGTRAIWDATGKKLTWEPNKDLISVYWLGSQQESGAGTNGNLKGMYNTIFKTTDGSSFSSEALVFEGGNIAVYPANKSFTKQGDIFLSVPTKQNSETIKNLPYVSNYFVAGDWLDKNIAGYHNGIYAPVKMAANVLTLELNLANTAELTQKFGFEVQSVKLVSDVENTFAEKAALKIDGIPNDKGMAYQNRWNSIQTIKKSVRVAGIASENTLTTTDITKNSEGNYTVRFVVLPTKVETMTEASTIVVETNCGILTLQTKVKGSAVAKLNKDKDGNILVAEGGDKAEAGDLACVVYNGNKSNTIAELFKSLVSAYVHPADATDDSKFKGEMIGGHYSRSIAGDMANATLDGSRVYSEDDVVRYTSIHASMGSKLPMNLILSDNNEDGIWSISETSFNAVQARRSANADVTMSLSDDEDEKVTKLQLLGGGDVVFNNKEYNQWKNVADNSLVVILEAGKEWSLNTGWSEGKIGTLENEGTLTIKTTDEKSLGEKVVNEGTIRLGSNVVSVGTNLVNTATGKVEVAAGQDLRFDKNVESGLKGEINVAAGAYMTINRDIDVTSAARINNSGTVSSIAGNGGLVNKGVINVKDAASITYVQDNTNGVINLLNRNDEVKVEENKGKIVYKYNSAVDGTKFERVTSDKFTYVVFEQGNDNITLDEAGISDISMEFATSTTLKTNSDEIAKLVVAEGAELKLLTPSETYDNVLYVKDLANKGNITIGGKIYYYQSFDPEGVVRSVGNGAIVYFEATVSTVEQLQAALAAGKNVELSEALEINEDVTIDLNGCSITYSGSFIDDSDNSTNSIAFWVKDGGNLTIEGEGSVTTGNADYSMAVWANGGTVTIKGGTYENGGDGCDLIYVSAGGNVAIYGGTFIATENTGAEAGTNNKYSALNLKDTTDSSITVYGGSFYKFDPSNNVSENPAENFVADGYNAVQSGDYYVVSGIQ